MGAKSVLVCFVSVMVLLRWLVAIHPYSGFNDPPKFGDFEAQRHWMEITTNLPKDQWYTYKLSYWGLDYPPLTAYHSYIVGKIGSYFNESWFALESSEGHESQNLKLFMRLSVLVTDLLLYIPSLLMVSSIFSSSYEAMVMALCQPALILIDHGHFQYNHVMLALTNLGVFFILQKRFLIGSFFFCMSMGFKQMALYYAPAIFFYLLSICFKQKSYFLFLYLGMTVIASFALLLYPFDIKQVLTRVFPFQRGLYEDKVASFWCAFSPVLKSLLLGSNMLKISAFTTLLAFTPSAIGLLVKPRQIKLLYALCASSLSFFLFSFHVHEKTILLPLLPISLLLHREPNFSSWFILVATFTLYPLMVKDNLTIAYTGMMLIWTVLHYEYIKNFKSILWRLINFATFTFIITFHVLERYLPVPDRYPYLFPQINSVFGCCCFIFSLLYVTIRQFVE